MPEGFGFNNRDRLAKNRATVCHLPYGEMSSKIGGKNQDYLNPCLLPALKPIENQRQAKEGRQMGVWALH